MPFFSGLLQKIRSFVRTNDSMFNVFVEKMTFFDPRENTRKGNFSDL